MLLDIISFSYTVYTVYSSSTCGSVLRCTWTEKNITQCTGVREGGNFVKIAVSALLPKYMLNTKASCNDYFFTGPKIGLTKKVS